MSDREFTVAGADELGDGEMREVTAGGTRVGGEYHAIGATCPHYGAPLADGVPVDLQMRAGDGIYAAGDIARFPDPRTGRRVRIEHWRTAEQQGRVAAHNMAGKAAVYDGMPFFWTRQFDAGLLYVGHAESWDEIIYDGDVRAQDFCAFYVAGDRVLAAAGMNRDRDMAAVEELMRLQGLSHGNDVVVTDAVLADMEAAPAPPRTRIAESFDAELRGVSAAISLHRLVTAEANHASR